MTARATDPDVAGLAMRSEDGPFHLEPLNEAHREPLRAACSVDQAIWEIYFVNYLGAAFDRNFDALLSDADCCAFAAFAGGVQIGMTGYLRIAPAHRALEIGHSYIVPEARGTGANLRLKRLLINRAFACGFHRCELRVDTRNHRSQAAVTKLGAVQEGVLRDHLVTWNGHVRSSVVYSILTTEWVGG